MKSFFARQRNERVKPASRRRFAPSVSGLEDRKLLSTYTVLNTFASGAGSLANAVQQANLDSANDTINFAPGVTGAIVLNSQLNIIDNGTLTITGPGALDLSISNPNGRVFQIDNATVDIEDLGFSNSKAVATSFTPGTGGGDGGAILNNGGNLTLGSDLFVNNFATNRGGAVMNLYGTLNVSSTVFAGNSTAFHGGAIYNSGVMNATGNIFSANKAGEGGGAIESARSILALAGVSSTLQANVYAGNQAVQGGAVEVTNSSSLTSNNELYVSNKASQDAGALSVGDVASIASVDNSVFLANTALGKGGGIKSNGFLSLIDSTLQYNVASTGGAYYVLASGFSQSGNTISFNSQPETVTV